MELEQVALILAVVALAVGASSHSGIAIVIAIISLALGLSKEEYKEVALGLGVIAIILAFIPGLVPLH